MLEQRNLVMEKVSRRFDDVESEFEVVFRLFERDRETKPSSWVCDKELKLSELQADYRFIKYLYEEGEKLCCS